MTNQPHGTPSRYATGCPCDPCRRAHTERQRQRRHAIADGTWTDGYTNPLGAVRRLRALAVIGWPTSYIATQLGRDRADIRDTARGERHRITTRNADDIATLYQRIHTIDGYAQRSINRARRLGWHGPDAWDDTTIDNPEASPFSYEIVDDIAVRLALAGDRHIAAQLTTAERRQVIRIGTGRGMSTADLADLCAVNERRIARDRAAVKAAA